jgi:hypothetical protein
MERVIFTKEMIEECENDEQLCLVAFGQEEIRDISELIGRTVDFKDEEISCIFDDEYGNMYIDVEIEGKNYNIPEKYFKKI